MTHDDTGQFSLLIHNATPADKGQYMCQVSNPAGMAACVADIIVDGKYTLASNISLNICENRVISLFCSFSASVCSFKNDFLPYK